MLLIHVTTVPFTFIFFNGQIAYMLHKGLEVQGVSSATNGDLKLVAARENIPMHAIDMTRRINPLADLGALTRLYCLFRKLQPAIVHAHTPKGGLLGVLAARLARVPVVIYGMHGLPFVTADGLKRQLLRWTEAISCRIAHRVIAVSFAIRQQAIAEGFCPEDKIRVLGSGSANGVDAEARFNPDTLKPGVRAETRERYHISKGSLVLGFVGRVVKDKGILELAEAWNFLRTAFPFLYLLCVGPVELQDPVPPAILEQLQADPRVRFCGHVEDPVPLYAIMDILILPTYREGFPVSILEAGAMRLPVVATAVDGCTEAVVDGLTGMLVPPRNAAELTQAISRLVADPHLRRRMGEAGRQRVLKDFCPQLICQELYNNYIELLNN
jgi:glycosyltransferase involved in cell wall biosynthesis